MASTRTNKFKELIQENNLKTKKTVTDKYVIYSVLDAELVEDIVTLFNQIESLGLTEKEKFRFVYNEENYIRLQQLFVYTGSGVYWRPEDHLYDSKEMCPDSETMYVHARFTPTALYICSSVYEAHQNTLSNNVFIYPVLSVINLKTAKKN